MVRRLKSYQTSIGFFDLAIAAPSMKAAAVAWGTQTDVFKKGFAKETHDAAIVTATMHRPGVVLKRPVGSNEPFSEHAELPHLPSIDRLKETRPKPRLKKQPAALVLERERKRREAARKKEEAAREKRRKQQEQAIVKAERAIELAEREHERKVKQIQKDRAALETRSEAEKARWDKQKQRLESALRRARD
jgi:hypothetical protein